MTRPPADRPGRDLRAERWPGPAGTARPGRPRSVVVVGGGIAGLAAATALVERGVAVTVVEREPQLGGRVRSWPVDDDRTMSRGFHAFFHQYYNLRRLLRRVDPDLSRLRAVADYPLRHADGHHDSFRRIARTPPWNLVTFVARSPSFRLRELAKVDIPAALGLLDVDFPDTFGELDRLSAAEFLDRLRFPPRARHLALEVFARSFFSDPHDFSAGELVAMFHSYFIGSAEGLLFDVPVDDYDTALWAPLGAHLEQRGATVLTTTSLLGLDAGPAGPVEVTLATADGAVRSLPADAVVLATDLPGLQQLLAGEVSGLDSDWVTRIAGLPVAPPFAVWRLWLDRPVAPGRPDFLGTSGYGRLDNISVVNQFEAGAARWAERRAGSVVELHAYAISEADAAAPDGLRRDLLAGLHRLVPELALASPLAEEFLVARDCPAHASGLRDHRPGVRTPDARIVLAGDGVSCELPVALMERAATTGIQAANALLEAWGVRGHDLWSVPHRSPLRWPGAARRLIGRGESAG